MAAALLLAGALLGAVRSAGPPSACSTAGAPSAPQPRSEPGPRLSVPGGLISVAGAPEREKVSNATTDSITSTFLLSSPVGAEKNLSAFPPDANLALVELFYVFFKPNRLLATMSVVQPGRFTLRDTSQKVVLLVRNRLVASPQTSNKPPAEISVVPNPYLDVDQFPIIMGIGEGTLHLCNESAAQPVLRLEKRHIMDVYRDSSASAKSFTFTCSFSGRTQRFESAAFPGWFLSTSQQSNEPVRLTNRLGATEITDFYFRKV